MHAHLWPHYLYLLLRNIATARISIRNSVWTRSLGIIKGDAHFGILVAAFWLASLLQSHLFVLSSQYYVTWRAQGKFIWEEKGC